MGTTGNLLTSPVGQIWFMALNKPIENKKTGKLKREICLLFDSEKDKEFIAAIAAINPDIPVTASQYKIRGKNKELLAELEKGKTKISANTEFEVAVFDKSGKRLEEAPYFFKDSTGTAQMIVSPYSKAACINLTDVIIHNIENTGEDLTPEERRAKMEEMRALAVKAATGG